MSLTVTILGCGSSAGVPRVAQGWGVCDPANPKNRRRRCSILVKQTEREQGEPTTVLVDTSPDMREQLLDAGVSRLDAILFTHAHADHVHGIDDVRPVVAEMRQMIPAYMDSATADVVTANFPYIFKTAPGSSYPPLLTERRLDPPNPVSVSGPGGAIAITPIRLNHGEIDSLAFRFGRIAYAPDLKFVPDESVALLEDLDLWIVDCLRYKRHPSHLSLDETLAYIERLKPRRAILTNLSSEVDFAQLSTELPGHVRPAYDGLRVVLTQTATG